MPLSKAPPESNEVRQLVSSHGFVSPANHEHWFAAGTHGLALCFPEKNGNTSFAVVRKRDGQWIVDEESSGVL